MERKNQSECATCKWWVELEPRTEEWKGEPPLQMGECHGAPPTARTEANRLNPEGKVSGYWTLFYYAGFFPTTLSEDFCGAHQPKGVTP